MLYSALRKPSEARRNNMVYKVYTVFDKVAEEAGPPFTAINDGVAIRSFKEMNIIPSLRGDYELYHIGFYDSVEASITPAVTITVMEVDSNVKQADI